MKVLSITTVLAALLLAAGACSNNANKANKGGTSNEAKTEAASLVLPDVETAQEALDRLREGNKRFVAGENVFPDLSFDRRAQEVEAQTPFATIVGCSDSRVPVEIVFDQGIGDLFVIRTAGNTIAADITMGSLDYSLEHLDVKLVVVLGHEKCGGITGALEKMAGHDDDDEEVDKLLAALSKGIKQHAGKPAQLEEAVVDNIEYQVETIKNSPLAKRLIAEGRLKVVGAKYNIENGEVEFIL